MRLWCISTSKDNWEICRKNRTWGMDARYYVTFEKFLKPGDRAIVYNHGGIFVAVVEFVGDYFFSEEDIGWTKGKNKFLFPYRIKFELLEESTNPPSIYYSTGENGEIANWTRPNLIDEVSFIADKGRTWNQYLQVSIIRITNEDFDVVSNAIQQSQMSTRAT